MFVLYRKELNSFFSTLTGYIAIIVFLIITGLFVWVFPGDFNILKNGFSSIDGLFIIAPWVFLFLIPAVTMRLFSEEKKSGTIELLFTKPISDLNIILAKYFAGLTVVTISLLPTLTYFLSVYLLGNPIGNIDTGGTWGSFIGLFFLSAIYVSIGIFSSSLTDNQIVSFILSMLISFIIYIGFDYISELSFWGGSAYFISNLGISFHYSSISRGVIDTRDIIYFLSAITLFIFLTKLKLESRKW
jgi:ABC-2 type transport system permease protein